MWRIAGLPCLCRLPRRHGPAQPAFRPAGHQPPPPRHPAAPAADADRPTAAMVWGVAILGTLVILSIVCVPSRKG